MAPQRIKPVPADSDQIRQPTQGLTRREFLTRTSSRAAQFVGAASLGSLAAWSLPALAAENPVDRLAALGIDLPETPAPVANYVPFVVQERFAFIAGQIAFREGTLLHPGSVPNEVSLEQAREAARQCGLNILAALNGACSGDLNRVRQCMRLDGFVASAAGFTQQPAVMNAASDLMVAVFGDAGRHTRTAVGVNELPLNASVEISAVFVID